MAKVFDLIVVGGGPAGLEAARTAARFGLRVARVERKSHPALLMRSCTPMFLMNIDTLYNESMYLAPQQQRWVFPVNLARKISRFRPDLALQLKTGRPFGVSESLMRQFFASVGHIGNRSGISACTSAQ